MPRLQTTHKNHTKHTHHCIDCRDQGYSWNLKTNPTTGLQQLQQQIKICHCNQLTNQTNNNNPKMQTTHRYQYDTQNWQKTGCWFCSNTGFIHRDKDNIHKIKHAITPCTQCKQLIKTQTPSPTHTQESSTATHTPKHK